MTKKSKPQKGSGGNFRKRGDGARGDGGKQDRSLIPAMWDVLNSLAEASEERAKKKEKPNTISKSDSPDSSVGMTSQ